MQATLVTTHKGYVSFALLPPAHRYVLAGWQDILANKTGSFRQQLIFMVPCLMQMQMASVQDHGCLTLRQVLMVS